MSSGDLFDPRSWESDRGGALSVILVVTIGIGVSMVGWRAPTTAFLGAGALALVYLALAAWLFDKVLERPPAWRWLYFAVQLSLAAGIFAVFSAHGSMRSTWLLLMPLIAQSRLALPRWGSYLVSVGALAMMSTFVYSLAGWRELPSFLGGMSAAIVFVLIFTEVAMGEAASRRESERLGEELAEANRRLSAYAVEVEELATTRERSRLAREIHDSLGHYLTVVNVQLEAALAVLDRDPERARSAVETARGLTREGLSEVRRSVAALRGSPLDGRTLSEALERLAASSGDAGVDVELEILGTSRALPPRSELTLFRSAQEGLTNVRKHARTDRARLSLDYRDGETVTLEIADHGRGADDTRGGFGLLGLEERVRQVGGSLRIRTAAGEGLALQVEAPG